MMTSSTHSFAYSYRLVKKCFLKICETSKCHNFLIFQPIFIRFSLFCSNIFTLSSKIKLNLFRISPLMMYKDVPLRTRRVLSLYKVYGDSAILVLNGTSRTALPPFWLSAYNIIMESDHENKMCQNKI